LMVTVVLHSPVVLREFKSFVCWKKGPRRKGKGKQIVIMPQKGTVIGP